METHSSTGIFTWIFEESLSLNAMLILLCVCSALTDLKELNYVGTTTYVTHVTYFLTMSSTEANSGVGFDVSNFFGWQRETNRDWEK